MTVDRGTRLYVMFEDKQIGVERGDNAVDSFTTSIPVSPGDEIYLLSVSYTTGDSAGHDDQVRYECIDVYADHALAAERAKAIRRHYDLAKSMGRQTELSFEERHEVAIKLGSGEDYRCHGPWLGYFARLEEVQVSRVYFGPTAVLRF